MEEIKSTLSRIENGVATIKVDAFIVPVSLESIHDLNSDCQNQEIERRIQFNKDNGTDFNVLSSKFVYLWYTGEDTCESENLGDHGFLVEDLNGTPRASRLTSHAEHVPAELFKDKVEGDTVEIVLPARLLNPEPGEEKNFKVRLICRLAQKEYRYRRHGTFHDVLSRLAG